MSIFIDNESVWNSAIWKHFVYCVQKQPTNQPIKQSYFSTVSSIDFSLSTEYINIPFSLKLYWFQGCTFIWCKSKAPWSFVTCQSWQQHSQPETTSLAIASNVNFSLYNLHLRSLVVTPSYLLFGSANYNATLFFFLRLLP